MKNIKKFLFIVIILLTLIFEKVNAEEIIPPVLLPEPISIHLTITTNTDSHCMTQISASMLAIATMPALQI